MHLCAVNYTACTSAAQSGCITCRVSQVVWIKSGNWRRTTLPIEYRYLWDNRNSVTYAKQTLLMLSFYKRTIKLWCQPIQYHRTAVTLQVRQCGKKQFTFCIYCANWQPHCNIDQLYSRVQVTSHHTVKSSVSISYLLTTYYIIHTVTSY